MKKYKLECTQADGSIFTIKCLPLTFKDAQELKKNYSSVFTKCKWRVVNISPSRAVLHTLCKDERIALIARKFYPYYGRRYTF